MSISRRNMVRSEICAQCSVRFRNCVLGKMARFLASEAETLNSDEKCGRDEFLILFDVLSVDVNRIVESNCECAFETFHGKTVDEHLIGIMICKRVAECFRFNTSESHNKSTAVKSHTSHRRRFTSKDKNKTFRNSPRPYFYPISICNATLKAEQK